MRMYLRRHSFDSNDVKDVRCYQLKGNKMYTAPLPPGGEYWRHKDLTPLVGTVSRWKVVRPWNTRQDAYLVAFYLLNDCNFWNYLGSAEQMELFESTSCQLLIGKNSMCTQPCHAAELLNKVKFNQLNRPVTELECFLSQMSATRYLYCWNSIQRSFL